MLSGSSALHYESGKQINTPSVKVTMRENSYGVSRASFGITASYEVETGVDFKGFVIIPQERVAMKFLTTFDKDGNEVAGTSLGMSSAAWSDLKNPDFYDTGETLIFDYVNNQGGTDFYIQRRTTSGGTVWSGVTTSYHFGGSEMGCVSTVSPTRLYSVNSDKNLVVINHEAGTWGFTEIANFPDMLGDICFAKRHGNEDIVIYPRQATAWYPGTSYITTNYWLRAVRTDGFNILGEKDVVDLSPGTVRVDFKNLSVGMSYYYLSFFVEKTEYTRGGKIQKNDYTYIDSIFIKSPDMLHWSNALNPGVTSPFENPIFFVVAGTSQSSAELIMSEVRGKDRIDILNSRHGTTSLDISNNVVSYNNQNNDRISLTLANYK